MHTNYYTLVREIRSFCHRIGVDLELKVVPKGKNFVPYASKVKGRYKIVLQKPEPTWRKNDLIKWHASFYHELGHPDENCRDDYEVIKDKKINMQSLFGIMLNIVSDYRQEKNKLGMYRGRDMVLSKGGSLLCNDIITNVGERLGQHDKDSDGAIFITLQSFSCLCREDWQRDMIGISAGMCAFFNEQQLEWMQRLNDGDYKGKLNACASGWDLYDLVVDMLTNVFDRDAEEEEQKAQQMQAEAESGGGEGGKGEKGDGEMEVSTGGTVHWSEIVPYNHDVDPSVSVCKTKIDYDGYDAEEDFRVNPDVNVKDYTNGSIVVEGDGWYSDNVRSHDIHTGLSNKIKKLLQVKTQTLNLYGQKKGKIAPKNIYRAGLKGAGDVGKRVFKKKIEQFSLDTAVQVVHDFSGSMGGKPQEHSILCGLMLNESISKIGVPVEILGFTDSGSRSVMNVFKTFDKPVSNDVLLQRMDHASNSMMDNADGEAILWCYDRLVNRENKRKLMIVLSDGQPATSRGYCYNFTKNVIRKIEKEKQIEIYGIGIMDNTVKDLYTHNQVISDASELEGAVLNVIKNYILS